MGAPYSDMLRTVPTYKRRQGESGPAAALSSLGASSAKCGPKFHRPSRVMPKCLIWARTSTSVPWTVIRAPRGC
ncbi:unnamed protein product [Euphydryas editha]|uniref:Uncharacterized protein n=1 Tax=Euphydryas editha TaxID=104508 RepID=A0AAU9U3L0_EUPED|nr:unnamed protein product [Euphydryas editha]